MATIGEQIRSARKAKGMTQDELASALNITRTGISKWETNDRVPDAEMLLRLSEVLDYQFTRNNTEKEPEETEENTESGKPEEKPAAVPDPRAAAAEAPAPAPGGKQNVSRSRRIALICAAALAVVILAVVLVLVNRPQETAQKTEVYTSGTGQQFNLEEFKSPAPSDPSRAYLVFQNSLTIQGEGLDKHIYYTFDMHEENGFPLHVDRLDLIDFATNGTAYIDPFPGEELAEVGYTLDIPPYGSFSMSGGTDMYTSEGKPCSVGAGIKMYCTDAGGDQMIFTSFVPFPGE